jgi:hydrogenase maturation protease
MTTPQVNVRPLVVGLGSPDRGDDAVGPIVARRVAALRLPDIRVLEREDPTSLIDLLSDHDPVVVVDAVHSDGPPGRLMVVETGCGAPALPARSWARTGRGGTHAFGLAAAVELARALGRLPGRLVLLGIEAVAMDHGQPLSPAVAAAVPLAVEAVIGSLRETDERPIGPGGHPTWSDRPVTMIREVDP